MSSGGPRSNLAFSSAGDRLLCAPELVAPPSTFRGSSVGSSDSLALTFPPPWVAESKPALLAA